MSGRGWAACSAFVVAGVVLIALPDDDARLFSISGTHGPAALDALGVALVLVAWAILLAGVWTRRARLPSDARWRTAAAAALIGGVVITCWSVLGDHGAWWLAGVALLAVPQLLAAAAVSRPQTHLSAGSATAER